MEGIDRMLTREMYICIQGCKLSFDYQSKLWKKKIQKQERIIAVLKTKSNNNNDFSESLGKYQIKNKVQ